MEPSKKEKVKEIVEKDFKPSQKPAYKNRVSYAPNYLSCGNADINKSRKIYNAEKENER